MPMWQNTAQNLGQNNEDGEIQKKHQPTLTCD